jgi:transposase InsO family protein
MIRQILRQFDSAKKESHLSWRQLCNGQVSYASLMRWRKRQRCSECLWQNPGPKKSLPLDWSGFYQLLGQLPHGRARTHGTGRLYEQFVGSLSRRQLHGLVQDYRQDQLASMKRIQWLWPGLAWSVDATEYEGALIVPVQDLAARYRFGPLVGDRVDGGQIAAHLRKLFVQHGPPLFLKRDNGSPFNSQPVEEVMAQFGVLPLNNPPHFPRYNGGMEKSIRDFKAQLACRLEPGPPYSDLLELAAEVTTQELNHRPRRCLKGRTACAVFHDEALHLHWTQRQRKTIFGLLLKKFGAMLEKTTNERHLRPATLWRVTVESWLRCQGLIVVRQNKKVSTNFPKIWSQN